MLLCHLSTWEQFGGGHGVSPFLRCGGYNMPCPSHFFSSGLQIYAAAGAFSWNSLTTAQCAVLFDCVRPHYNAFSIEVNAVSASEKINV